MTTATRTVRDAAETWLKRCKGEELDTQTIKTYRSQVETHVLPRIGGAVLADLGRGDIEEFMDDLLEQISREMTRKVMVSLKSLLNLAVARGWIATSPAALVKLKRQSRHDKEAIPRSEDDVELFEKMEQDLMAACRGLGSAATPGGLENYNTRCYILN